MSDLANCGGCGFGGGNNSCIWIILLLFLCGGNNGCGNGGFGGGDSCCEWIIILLILCSCCGNNSRSNDCGCGCGC